jgi:CDP-diacylglycerol--serine O-phosphatidyltransferase
MIPNVEYGVFLIILGAIFDLFDGYFARLLKASSELGKQLDSLADVITFGVAPAILYFKTLGEPGDYLTYIAPLILVSAGALRLARFNISVPESNYFQGLAIPSSGLFIAGIVLSLENGDPWFQFLHNGWLYALIPAVLMAALNISSLKMFSAKQIGSHKWIKYYLILLIIFLVFLLINYPDSTISFFILAYIVIAILDNFLYYPKRS